MARFGMLECGKNFKGNMPETCDYCHVLDDEDYRLNYCTKFKEINNFSRAEKAVFSSIYSYDSLVPRPLTSKIMNVWDVKTGRGKMQTNTY